MVKSEEFMYSPLSDFQGLFSVDIQNFPSSISIESFIMPQNGFGFFMKSNQPLLDYFWVVIQTSACFSSVQQPSSHLIITNLEEHEKRDLNVSTHDTGPGIDVVLVSREAIKQNQLIAVSLENCFFDPFHHKLAGNHFSFFHHLTNLLGLF